MIEHPSCIVTLDDKPFEVFMSFGLLNAVARHVGNPDNIGLILLNSDLREMVLTELLSERSKSGAITKKREFGEVDISLEDCEKLLEFAAEHVLDFFLRALEKANKLAGKTKKVVEAHAATSNGSKA